MNPRSLKSRHEDGLAGSKAAAGPPHSKGAPDRVGAAPRDEGGAQTGDVGKPGKERKKCRGASLRGQGSPGFILPASAVSEQENCVGAKPQNPVLFRVC